MSCVQATCVKPFIYTKKVKSPFTYGPHSRQCHLARRVHHSLQPSVQLSAKGFACKQSSQLLKSHLSVPVVKYQKLTPVGLFGGTGKSEGDGVGSIWRSLEKAIESFRKQSSVQDVLRQQMEKKEPYAEYDEFDDGDGDGNFGGRPPGGGGGGGGEFGRSKDEGFDGLMDEILQVFLATTCLVTMYIYIVFGEEMFLLIRDIIKYLCRGGMSERVLRVLAKLKCRARVGEEDPYWLERAIVNTRTWWDRPEKYENTRPKNAPAPAPQIDNGFQDFDDFEDF